MDFEPAPEALECFPGPSQDRDLAWLRRGEFLLRAFRIYLSIPDAGRIS